MLRRIQQLDLCDVEALLEILASASDLASAESLNERRRKLLSALARIVDADMWFWSITQHERSYEAKGSSAVSIYGGQIENEALMQTVKSAVESRFDGVLHSADLEGRHPVQYELQHISATLFDGREPNAGAANDWILGDSIFLLCHPEQHSASIVAIVRLSSSATFSNRERTLAQLALQHMDWLHKHDLEISFDPGMARLSNRCKEVLQLLLSGHSPKQIAAKLRLSTHTVGDYVKTIYQRLGVSSRSELHAYFHFGKRSL